MGALCGGGGGVGLSWSGGWVLCGGEGGGGGQPLPLPAEP